MPTIRQRYESAFEKDRSWSERAQDLLPDGASSDSRLVDPFSIYVKSAQGSKKTTVGGRELIDYWAGHGALLLGHAPQEITAAAQEQLPMGTHPGAGHPLEVEWATRVCEMVPSAEQVRFTGSGTEAVLLAVHLARVHTQKNRILRLAGHYHGWHASLDPKSFRGEDMLECPNDLDAIAAHLERDPDIAAVLLEPTGPCSGVVPLDESFASGLRELTERYGAVLIFDEVVTGFRMSPGGAQALFGVHPDLTVMAKVLSGGLPGGAVAGRRDLLSPIGKKSPREGRTTVPHYGTFNGNPLSAATGVAMLRFIETHQPHAQLERDTEKLRQALNEVIDRHHLDWAVYGQGSCIKFLIGHGMRDLPAKTFDSTRCAHDILLRRGRTDLFQSLRLAMLVNGVDISLSSFLTTAHTTDDGQVTAEALDTSITWMKQDNLL